ncbi:MAG: SPOR domain-containing protein [Gammaproteobacteria bacterium]|nr:SPOR domain-containing protein [Gammaproteobacteria bacterium]
MRQLLISTPEFNQRLDLIRHLIGSSDRIPLIRGTDGVGKSTLLTRLREIAPDEWEVCRIEATPLMQPDQLYPALAKCYGSLGENFNDPASLVRRFDDYHQAGRLPVILVDDAHLLPVDGLLALIDLHVQAVREGGRIALVLAASALIDGHFKSEPLRGPAQLIQVLELLPFNREQTAQMVREALALNGGAGMKPRPASWIDKLYSESGGVPGKIRERLEEVLGREGLSALKMDSSRLMFLTDIPMPVIIGSVLLALLMGFTLIFQDEINSLFEPQVMEAEQPVLPDFSNERALPLALPEQVEAEPDSGPEALTSELEGMTEESAEPLQEDPLLAEQIPTTNEPPLESLPKGGAVTAEAENPPVDTDHEQEHSDSEDTDTVSEPLKQETESIFSTISRTEIVPLQPTSPGEEAMTHRVPEKAPKVSSAQPKPAEKNTAEISTVDPGVPAAAPIVEQGRKAKSELPEANPVARGGIAAKNSEKKDPAPVVDEGIRTEAWLLRQRPDHYTLQLIAVRDEKGIDQFIRRHQLRGGTVASFRSLRNGAPWFSVVSGVYPSRTEATEALAKLPQGLSGQGAWPRTFGSIQEAIRAK